MYREGLAPRPADSKCSINIGYDHYHHSISIIRSSPCSLLGSPLPALCSPTRALCFLTVTVVMTQNLALETALHGPRSPSQGGSLLGRNAESQAHEPCWMGMCISGGPAGVCWHRMRTNLEILLPEEALSGWGQSPHFSRAQPFGRQALFLLVTIYFMLGFPAGWRVSLPQELTVDL